ncbi:Nif3-like dinuclear metal center hexameric protein [Roseivirga pacifica]|uniref:Nif3-like dinuclear metal center hexameric protein n=1 Tax=Roseivirga pacifica TaxID=1267423 RepID=UPI002094670E|nr:Nif3-like dinuclear metal center hexameric protein [Roseivirga pacifica]MCO6360940.1 Nif3-like dinuclear metal center hexameric protein [Roseivirga pacifica]MCO6368829.1 Nif3-like dinuclear metal center hexameric protein [Roseivirga pacifica]MCO6372973.1 Nif3-like dinuclear metal center hexameric protein [Roseivirga pacifica]MCO6377033.1 Nif3-like dinuclear metal center hexameric protein [Roseivirga pacifica]MCO6377690.1 Nif3-like dinuclear metal center hexameric protein [Roseivirga pacific
MPKINDITRFLENIAPSSYQESYDNSGLITGDSSVEVTGVLISLDCIESVVDEAISKKCNLIVAHHPIVFGGLKRLTGKNYVERTVIKAIKNDIAIYAIHTNLDNVLPGVNNMIAQKIGLSNLNILAPKQGTLCKLEAFIPQENTDEALDAIHKAGAGNVGNYSQCSFRVLGTGTFMPNEEANPTIGTQNQQEYVEEHKVEVIFPQHLQGAVLAALKKAHPYEEVAYYIQHIANTNQAVGSGIIGKLAKPMTSQEFLAHLKDSMNVSVVKYTPLKDDKIETVAVCGGAGSFLLKTAKARGAQAFVSADFKYHEFFDAEGKIMIADIGHYESEVFTKELIDGFLNEKFANIATYLSEVNTNPVKYF